MKLNDAFKILVEKKQYQWKSSTYYKYHYLYDHYIDPYFKNIEINEINDILINQYFDTLQLSNGTKLIIRNLINQILNPYDIKIHYLIQNTSKEIVVLNSNEQKRLIDYLNLLPDDPLNIGILLCLYTGLRLGEICALTWDDIDLEEGSITILKTVIRLPKKQLDPIYKTELRIVEPKSQSSNRKIPIPDLIVKKLTQLSIHEGYFLSQSDKVYDPRKYEYYFSRLLKKANIRKVNFHALRHTFATRCIEKGIDVKTISEILGHSDVLITIKYYVKSSFEFKKKQIEKLIDE